MIPKNIVHRTPISGRELLGLFNKYLDGKSGNLTINRNVVTHYILHPPRGNTVIHAFDWWEKADEHHSVKLYIEKEDSNEIPGKL